MKTPYPYPRLSDLMGGYLHQDFDLSYESDDAAISDYAATHRADEVSQAVEEIDQLLAGPATGLLERFKDEVSRWDFIIGETDDEARAWLLKARRILVGVPPTPEPDVPARAAGGWRGLYRIGDMQAGDTFARVKDGLGVRTITEAAYRISPYLPVYDALPSREEFLNNGGRDA